MICIICQTVMNDIDLYGKNQCPQCGQQYCWDESQQIVLTDEQIAALRALLPPTVSGDR